MDENQAVADDGEELTFEQALAIRHRAMFAYAFTCCRNLELANVVVKQATLTALNKAHDYDPESDFEEWLYLILRQCWDDERQTRDLPDRAPAYVHDHAAILFIPELYADDAWAAEKAAVADSLDQLGETDRRALKAFIDQGDSYAAIAKRFNLSPAKLKLRLERSRSAFRTHLDGSFEDAT